MCGTAHASPSLVLAQIANAIYRGSGNGGAQPVVPPYEVQVPYRAVPQR